MRSLNTHVRNVETNSMRLEKCGLLAVSGQGCSSFITGDLPMSHVGIVIIPNSIKFIRNK